MSQTPKLFSQFIAKTFLARLENQHFRSHNKHIIDGLPDGVRRSLFSGLMELANKRDTVVIDDSGHQETLAFISTDDFDLLPYLVVNDAENKIAQQDWGRNAGVDGFASLLRDYYAKGAIQTRLLVTFTPGGNETQKSAQDSAIDRELITLKVLCEELAKRHDLKGDPQFSQILDSYLAYTGRQPWEEVLNRLQRFLDKIKTLPPTEWGKHLSKLGPFLNDSSAEYATGEAFDLPRQAKSHRAGPNNRLNNNAALRGYLESTQDDPLTDSYEEIGEEFDTESAEAIRDAGDEGLDSIDIAILERRNKTKQSKNKFDWSAIETRGTHASHKLAGANDDRILLASTNEAFKVTVPLERDFDPERDHAHLLIWETGKRSPTALNNAVVANTGEPVITFEIPVDKPFTVLRLALSGGPRSYQKLHDSFHVVVYNTEQPAVAWDTNLEISLENQAWVRDGHTATISVRTPDDKIAEESFESGSGMKISSDKIESIELEYHVDKVCSYWAHGGKLPIHICWVEEQGDKDDEVYDFLEELPFKGYGTDKKAILSAFQKTMAGRRDHASYLTSLTHISRDSSENWSIELARERLLSIRSWNKYGQEEAVGELLRAPNSCTVERVGETLSTKAYKGAFITQFKTFMTARTTLFDSLLDTAAKHEDTSRLYISLMLTNLRAHRAEIIQYYQAWLDGCKNALKTRQPYGDEHKGLLQTDLLIQKNNDAEVDRLTVLPTHPWMLRALLSYQQVMNRAFSEASSPKSLANLITRDELRQFVPERIVEDWYLGTTRFRAENASPFHLEFLPEDKFETYANLIYVERVVRNKIQRYLEMHRHLQNARRTLRIGFVNPGDAHHLFAGIQDWIKRTKPKKRKGKKTATFDDFLETIPKIEIILFSEDQSASTTTGAAFDTFFRENLESPNSDDVTQVMLSKIRYGKRAKLGPDSDDDYVHICFAHGLVNRSQSNAVDGNLDDGWDGCFAGGLMATNLRTTRTDTDGNATSERGLWVGPVADAQREGIAALLTLNRAAKRKQVVPNAAIFWSVTLPSLDSLQQMYDNSDWVVHLDRELGLDTFRNFGRTGDSKAPTIIEYSDQEDPQSPGFDVITVTKHAAPYLDQMSSVLDIAGLNADDDNPEHAQESMIRLLDDINILSGSWALDFLMGNIAQTRYSNRLKGNVGSALTFRWLRRHEEPTLAEQYGTKVVPVYVSLEEIIRATPAAGLKTSEGLVRRYSNDDASSGKAAQWCDDMLVLYLTPASLGQPYKIFGRIIEVKFGSTAVIQAPKGVEQVRSTHQLLSKHLAGGNSSLEAPFRHRQLSLLIKSQLEQALSAGLIDRKRFNGLNLPTLSAYLASGNYEIDYVLSDGERQIQGDVFALSTDIKDGDNVPNISIANGVRVMKFGVGTLRELAFDRDTAPTQIGHRLDTLPKLGRLGDDLSDLLQGEAVHIDSTGLGDTQSEAGYDFDSQLLKSSTEQDCSSRLEGVENNDQTGATPNHSVYTHNTSPPVSSDTWALKVDWREAKNNEIVSFIQNVINDEMYWSEYSQRMKEYTGHSKAPIGKNWSHDRILEYFRDYGFVRREDGIRYLREEELDGIDSALNVPHSPVKSENTPQPESANGSLSTANEPQTYIHEPTTKSPVISGAAPNRILNESKNDPIKQVEPDTTQLLKIIDRLGTVFDGHGIELEAPPSIKELEYGPRLLRVYVRLSPSETINSVRNRSEDIARTVGTSTSDIHIMNAPEKRAVALDLPIKGMGYTVTFNDLQKHDSFAAAGYEMELGFCAGVHVTGKPHWIDLAEMPHALVAGTTGSGKTVFLRSIILTWVLTHTPNELEIRLSSSKPMDFNIFTQLPHVSGHPMATTPAETLALVRDLIGEMDRRITLLSDAYCDNLKQYNDDPHISETLPRIVAVLDEYAETVLSFDDTNDRKEFQNAVSRLAQKARAAGIHLVLCMQRPDSKVVQGAIKSNVLHRFALKLPQNHDSRVILDEPGAEALLGKGDMLYKDASSKVHRLQVPYLDSATLKRIIMSLSK